MRWKHPQRGLVFPDEFISLAEETSMTLPLGRWGLAEACRQAREWQQRYPTDPPLKMSVNLSARQFQHPDLVEEAAQILQETGLESSSLVLEITEGVVMEAVESTVATLRKLKSLGVQLAIDDFGTGYSSLSYLKRFPVDSLKIDKSFVDGLGQNPEDTAIVRAVTMLADTLGVRVTAEGVERADQLARLKALGCELGQGYYFTRPMLATAVDALFAAVPYGK